MVDHANMSLEQRLAETNAGFFLREFSCSKTKISLPAQSEIELADHIVCIDNILAVFQLKQRSSETTEPDQEIKWYQNKIKGKAIKQVRDTCLYLSENAIRLENDQGHIVKLPQSLDTISFLKLVVYEPGKALPEEIIREKGYESSKAGFIHLLHIRDYLGILHSLVTLTEIVDYFSYREELVKRFPKETVALPEPALVGHYIVGDVTKIPSINDEQHLSRLANPESFQIFPILQQFKEKTYSMSKSGTADAIGQSDYYKILKEMLYLNRSELAEFKRRFMWAFNACGAKREDVTRFASPAGGYGFVFIPIPLGYESNAQILLRNFTELAKYDLHLERCLGISFRRDGEYRLIDWMYYEAPWKEDRELENLLKHKNPFREAKLVQKPRY